MDGPWTQFAAPPAEASAPSAVSDGPWTQFKPASPVAPNPNAGLNEYGITSDPQQFNGPLAPAEQGIGNVTNAVSEGARAGFGQGPLGMSPQTDAGLVRAGVFNGPGENNPIKGLNRAIVTPLAAAGDLALRTGGALVGAYQRGVSQAGEEVGAPQLGRDLAALPEAFPTGDVTGGTALPHGAAAAPESAPVERGVTQFPVTAQSVLENPPSMLRPAAANDAANNPLARVQTAVEIPAFAPPGAAVPPELVQATRPSFIPPEPVVEAAPQPVVASPTTQVINQGRTAPGTNILNSNRVQSPTTAANDVNPLMPPPANDAEAYPAWNASRTQQPAIEQPLVQGAPPHAAPPAAVQPSDPVVAPQQTVPRQPVQRLIAAPLSAPNSLLATAGDSAGSAPQNALAGPGPQSVGSAASRDLTHPSALAMSPQDAAASQATGENWRLAQPAVQGIDKTEYVKGVVPTAAEVAGNADVSAQQKYMMQTPGQVEKFRAQQATNNERRIDHYDELAGTPTIVDTMKDARSAQADADLKEAWGNKKAVDAQPVVDQIDAVLAGPQGKLSAVRAALKSVRDTLHDADGNLEIDPEVLYGARREVAAMLGKAAQQERPTLRDAASQLGNVKDALDQTIEKGAPGYQKYLRNYSDASRPIDARELLLDARPGLTNGADRTLSFAKVDRLMRDIVAKRQAPGANAAKSLTDDQMEGLWNLHSDLKRLGNLDLGRPRGSDTSALGRMGGALGLGGAHVVANALLPVAGSFLVHEGKSLLAGRAINRRVNKLMDGPNYKP